MVFSVFRIDPRIDPIVPCQVVLMAPEEFTFLCESFEATWYPHGVCFLLKYEGYDVFFFMICV